MKIPPLDETLAQLIDAAYEAKPDKPRPHFGASLLGHPCDRWLWLSFRWAVQEKFSGRMLRLFQRGHREEKTIISDLRLAGLVVRQLADQAKVDFGSHVSGSIDAIIESGVPEAIKKMHIAEFKTHSLKSFNDLSNNGVEKSKPMHYAQVQVYMHGTKIDRALYVAVCKDDDRIYTERVKYDKAYAEKLVDRGHRIALSERMPEPISTDSSWYQCKFCPAHSFCHDTKLTKHVNCRTCAHSTPTLYSTWDCARFDADDIPVDFQHTGCDDHTLHPDLVPWPMKESAHDWIAVYEIDGVDVQNGAPDANVFASKEILANPRGCTDKLTHVIRQTFPGAQVIK